ncbi:Laminin G 2 and/or Laminin II domain containing protein [Asbolus verrucosus]|uniref:Laminin G 2 and/or Laminin II domain containing protein n=1 Tax=Asbolus verrucosus TaxID=1661398 RepID=A0A482VI35_ASBVE|nr:Laminin G 2 and/or Laminin II domain containing protein [Asbolus verrucosus]
MESKNNLIVSETLNKNSTKFIDDAGDKLNAMQKLFEELEVHNNEFKTTLDNNEIEISKGDKLRPEVEEHAKSLTERAMKLDSLLTETRHLSGNAVKAAKAYADIVDAVGDAENASLTAQADANNAVDLLSGIENKVFTAEQNSSQALNDAFEYSRATNEDLKSKLNSALTDYIPVGEASKQNKQKLDEIDKILKNIQNQSLDQSYVKASRKADEAVKHVSSIDSIANETFSKLKNETEEARLLPKHIDDMERELVQTRNQLNSINENLPAIIESLDEIPKQQSRLQQTANNIEDALEKLNQKIILARDVANQIKIGMKFYPNTTLELKNPSNLEDLSTSTRISGYFKTSKPNGLLWYLGNPPNTKLPRTRSDDYMALIVQNGYPVLKLDIGNGLETLINDKYVSNDVWYQFIVDRIGHNAKLTIREELEGGIENITKAEKTLEGPHSIFNLDRNKSKLFVGSFPVDYKMQDEIQFNSFDGEIEDLVIGDKPVSLWNFVRGYENHYGAKERDKLVNLQPSTGFRFNGNGYAILNAQSYALRTRSNIQLSFKTFATEGLLFLAGKGKTFIALELRNGKVLYQYNLGENTKVWHTSKTYNDGQWHSVEASREGSNGRFNVDGEDIPDTTAGIRGISVETIETVSFGGYPNKHSYIDVTQTKFDGCIDKVAIMGSPLDLRTNIKAYDVIGGCPAKFAQTVSFNERRPGYIAHDGLSVSDDFMISLKFKTKEKNGLIFYATDQLQTANISLALKDGHLHLISQKIELNSKETFNDNQWHVVSVMHNSRELRMDFDDWGNRTVMDSHLPSLYFLHGILYIGGLPKKIVVSPGTVASELPFKGCIGDLTVKGNVINFANSTNKLNEILGKCILDGSKGIEEIDVAPSLPPLGPLQPSIDEISQETTKSPYGLPTTIRGDGGFDFLNTGKSEEVTESVTQQPPPPPPAITNGSVGRPLPTTPKPPPEDACALPLDPLQEGPGVYRFGAQKGSRLEFNMLRGKYKKQFDFALEFKSYSENGVIFYIFSESRDEYVALFLQNGYIVYTFSNGRATSVIKSDRNNFNDSAWHLVEFSRDGGRGKLVIDNVVFADERSGIEEIKIRAPLLIGGLDPNHYNEILGKLNTTESFKGCIRKVTMNNLPLQGPKQIAVVPCFNQVEPGTFFPLSNNGFVRLKEPRFRIGEVFNIKLDIKARRESGVLIAAQGKKDYFVLEMVDGEMRLTVENGRGPIIASFNSNKKFYFCDGQWHSIQAVKSKNVVTLSVDNVFTEPNLGDHSSTSTDTGSALFLGGHRYLTTRAKGITTKLPYVGCVKNVFINEEPIEILAHMAEGNVIVGTCPTN